MFWGLGLRVQGAFDLEVRGWCVLPCLPCFIYVSYSLNSLKGVI